MRRTAVINVVGLTDGLSRANTRRAFGISWPGGDKASVEIGLSHGACTAQSTYLTGTTPHAHGIVGNGWYNR